MSPVKSTAPTVYGVSWMFDGCRPASPPSARAHRSPGRPGARRCAPSGGAPATRWRRRRRCPSCGDEVGRGVRTVERPRAPTWSSSSGSGSICRVSERQRASGARCSTSPVRSSRPPWPPKPPSVNVDADAEHLAHVEAAAHQHVRPQPGTGAAREGQASGRPRRGPARTGRRARRRASRRNRAPVRHTTVVGREAQRGPGGRALEAGRTFGVAEDAVAEPERAVVHRTARRHADVPQPDPAGQILHGGERRHDARRPRGRGYEWHSRVAVVTVAGAERGRVDERGEQAEVGLDAAHAGAQRARRASRRRPRRGSAPCTMILASSGS